MKISNNKIDTDFKWLFFVWLLTIGDPDIMDKIIMLINNISEYIKAVTL